MRRLIFILIFLSVTYQSNCQTSFNQEVWKHFHELVSLPYKDQIIGFQKLKTQCIQQKITNDTTYTNLLFLYAGALFATNDAKQAVSLLEEAIGISVRYPKGTPVSYLSKYHFYLGYYKAQQGHFDLAIKNYDQAYRLGLQQPNKWGISALACQALAHLYYESQDYKRGLAYALNGIHIAKQFGDSINLTKNIYEECINLNALDSVKEVELKLPRLLDLAKSYATDYEKGIYYKLVGDINIKKKVMMPHCCIF